MLPVVLKAYTLGDTICSLESLSQIFTIPIPLAYISKMRLTTGAVSGLGMNYGMVEPTRSPRSPFALCTALILRLVSLA